MMPSQAFPLGAKTRMAGGDFVDTGYPCRITSDTHAPIVTAAPPGLVTVGGHRLLARDLDRIAEELGPEATIAALPHALLGQRLAAQTADPGIANDLQRHGASPLIVGALRRKAA